ncbi:MAG: response regulator [Pirellulaceae bacterium]
MPSLPPSATVYISDHDDATHEWIAQIVRGLGCQAAACSEPEALLTARPVNRPSCLVLEIAAPEMGGVAVFDRLRRIVAAAPPVIVHSSRSDVPTVVQAMRCGVSDYLEKPCQADVLAQSIRRAVEIDLTKRERVEDLLDTRQRLDSLTAEQRTVLDLLLQGRTNKQIASQIGASVRTAQFRRADIMKKLEVDSLAQLVRKVARIERETDSDGPWR